MRKTVQVLSFFGLFVICYLLFVIPVYAWEDVSTEDTYSGRAADDGNLNPKKDGWTPWNADHNLYMLDWDEGYDPGPKPYLGNIVNTPNSGPVCNPYRVNAQTRGPKSSDVTMCGFSTSPGQAVHAPQTCQYPWLVVYADENFITLEVGTSDFAQWDTGIFNGYVVHIDGLRVDQSLLDLYRKDNPGGLRSGRLPIVKPNDIIGTAAGSEVRVSVRDNGDFMDPRSQRDWWEEMDWSQCKQILSTRYGITGVNKKRNPDEFEGICQRISYASGPDNPDVPIYTDKNGQSQPEMRTDADANFDFSAKSRGVHCGTAKSQPLVLTEVSPFDIKEGVPDGICKDTWWSGEIQFNYSNETNNFRIPFAQEMADHWAGTLDAEHMKESDIDSLFAAAYPVFNLDDTPDAIHKKVRATATASAEIKRRQGVLRALLPKESQDTLKCSFVRFVQKKLSSNGGTLYKDFKIEGTRLADIPCPPSVDNKKLTTASPEYLAWQKDWASKWQKMGLIPNEKSIGDLDFRVCGDRSYYLSIHYPEVFRLGLAANELYKIFTDKKGLERYYLANNDLNNMKLPVDKNPILTANLGASLPTEPTIAQTQDNLPNCSQPINPPANTNIQPSSSPLPNTQPNNIKLSSSNTVFANLISFVQNSLPKVGSAFAQTIDKLNPLKDKTVKLLAQAGGCFSLSATVSPRTNADGSIDVDFVLHVNGIVHKGGHFQIFANGSRATQLARILTPGGVINISSSDIGGPIHLAPGQCTVNFSVKIDECNELGNQEYYSCDICTGECNIGNVIIPPGPGGPETKCDTPTCNASCSLCPRAQLYPSDDALWPQSYPKGHMLLGTTWTGSGYSEGPKDAIHYKYTIPAWDGTYDGIQDVPGCQYKECREDDKNCARDYCFEGHGCGHIDCGKVHDRVIDIYNEVPFMASVWRQTAESDNGVEKFCYNQCIKGKGTPERCRNSCTIPSGFFNIFKPKCDPNDPTCPSYGAASSNPNCYDDCIAKKNTPTECKAACPAPEGFIGCTTKEKYVFDAEGDFGDNPGASYLTYTFSPRFGSEARQFNEGVTVTQKSPGTNENAKVLFYKMGGLCNTNKWVGEKYLNPGTGEGSSFSTGMGVTPTSGPCKGKRITLDEYYDKDNCGQADPEPICCGSIGQGKYAAECSPVNIVWCRPNNCNKIPAGQPKNNCGSLLNANYKLGSQLLQ